MRGVISWIKMRVIHSSLVLFALLQAMTVCSAKRGFILTSPRVLDAGTTEYFTVALFDVPSRGSVTLGLRTDRTLVETKVPIINNYNTWVQMDIPDIEDNTATLYINGRFSNGYRIKAEKDVDIRRRSIITFVQTDKPIYKPGQTVRFRILPMNNQLVPLPGITIGNVWIEDPSGIRVAQWKQVNMTEGIAQLELPLSDEPVYGIWTIHTDIKDVAHSQTFKVEEYVLPKYDVVITPPSYVLVSDKEILVKICARYTYGKNVEGMIHAKMTYKPYSYELSKLSFPSVEYEGKIAGCSDFIVDSEELQIDNGDLTHRTIQVTAEITENGTGIVQTGNATLKITHNPLKMEFLGSEKGSHYFKPGLPYYGKLKILNPDGTPSSSQSIKICAVVKIRDADDVLLLSCNTFISNKEGLIDFVIPSQGSDVLHIRLDAKPTHINQVINSWGTSVSHLIISPSAAITIKPWHSPSLNFLQIEPITSDVRCDRLEKVRIRYTTAKLSTIKFYHQVFSRGRIVQLGSHTRSFNGDEKNTKDKDTSPTKADHQTSHFPQLERHNLTPDFYVGEFVFSFDARATMSPVARLLVFYVREDGEIVADSRSFSITHCLRNQVKYLFRHSQQYPGAETAMLLSAMPSSLCGTYMVDKSVHILHPEQSFSKDKVFKLMESFDVGKSRFSRRKICSPSDYPLRRKRMILGPHMYPGSSRLADAFTAFEEAGAIIMSDLTLETSPCPVMPRTYYLTFEDSFDMSPGMPGLPDRLEARFPAPLLPPETINEPEPVEPLEDSTPSYDEIRSFFPETWLWELHKIGESGEIALKSELPHSITTWVGGAVCVHTKHGLGISDDVEIVAFQPFFASFNLPYSIIQGETVTIAVSVFNYLSECLPINLALEPSESFSVVNASSGYYSLCVCGETSKTAKFQITPNVIGSINITVYVYTVQGSNICGNEITSRISARDAVTRQLLVEPQGIPKEETFNYFFCPQNENGSYVTEVDLLLPENLIAGSERAYMYVTGDVMGPALNGLEKLVRLPVGCGEQNMVLFTPNIFVLDYLTNKGHVSDGIKSKALDFMLKGYQRELRYRHKDGSYSAFGESDSEGSIWLTSFVVKSFAQARRFITIDEQDLVLSATWIISHQLENGCFASKGKLLNKNLQGGLKGQGSLAPLTAYILIALLESGFNNDHIVKNALHCLHTDDSPSSYSLALYSYAAVLSESNFAYEWLQELQERAVKEGNVMYWSSSPDSALAVEVETAGYVILAMLKAEGKDAVTQVLPIVRWIAKQRNANGGFVSTQDTVVALQALSEYSAFISSEEIDMEVAVVSDNLERNFKVEESNKLLMQTLKIPVVPTVADIEATGKGCALAQFSLRYNVENTSGSDAFDMSIKATRQGSYGCNIPSIGVCMRYKIPREESNMAVLEIKMVSGYMPDEWSIYKLRENPSLGLKRHEIIHNTVNLYFDQITNQKTCFYFFAKSEIEVENGKDAVVKLYDYYQPDLQVTATYNIPPFCSLAPLPELPPLQPYIFDEEQLIYGIYNNNTIPELNAFTNYEVTTESNASTSDRVTTEFHVSRTNQPEETPEEEEKEATSVTPTSQIMVSTNNGEATKLTTMDFMQEEGIQADSPVQEIPRSSDLFQNFVNFDEDLSFPDGVEGNQPVYVSPPEDMNITLPQGCPMCAEHFPEDFVNIFCTSTFALRVSIRNPEKGSVKILHDISPRLSKPHVVKAFGKFHYDASCNCSLLTHSGTVLIFGNPNSLWSESSGFHHVNLTSSVHIIASTGSRVQPLQVKNARRQCT